MIYLEEIQNKVIKRENLYYLIIVLIIFSIDRISKIEIIKNFGEDPFYINDFINFDLVWNTGIGFGLLSSYSSLVYNLITLIIGLVILYYGYN